MSNEDGYREILGAAEGAKEDKEGWGAFVKDLKARGLEGVSSDTNPDPPATRILTHPPAHLFAASTGAFSIPDRLFSHNR
jgi:hypothetical protein